MLRLQILGPVEIVADGEAVPRFRPQLQGLLGYLVLNVNQHVEIDRITAAIWGDDAPSSSRAQIHTMVAKLRRTFATLGDEGRIVTGPSGYQLLASEAETDLTYFESLVAEARVAVEAGDGHRAEALLIESLGLWRAPALSGARAAFTEASRAHLDEKRLVAQELLGQVWLDLGKHGDLASELPALFALYPAREQLARLLMLALYRSGQQTAALAVARELRTLLVEDYGIEPAKATQDLQGAILRCDPALDLDSRPTVTVTRPRRSALPRTVNFVGRRPELDRLDRLVEMSGAGDEPPPVLLHGPPGVGKTALVLNWLNRSQDDGAACLYLDVGMTDAQLDGQPLTAVALQKLNVPLDRIPDDPAEQTQLYRSMVGDPTSIVVLDHVESSAQARELLPPGATALFVVVSRRRLDGLLVSEAARPIELGVLDRSDSIAMLRMAWAGRPDTGGADAMNDVAALCDDWPLAIRIALAKLVSIHHGSIEGLVIDLADPKTRLSRMHLPEAGASLLDALDKYAATLSPVAARMYGALSSTEFSGFTLADAARLAHSVEDVAERILADLLAGGFIQRISPGLYRMQELMRLHAAALPAQSDSRMIGEIR